MVMVMVKVKEKEKSNFPAILARSREIPLDRARFRYQIGNSPDEGVAEGTSTHPLVASRARRASGIATTRPQLLQ